MPLPLEGVLAPIHPARWDVEVAQAQALWQALSPLEKTYPGFGTWYFGKVIPGLLTGQRHILRAGPLGAPTGVAIVKRDDNETKFCTIWIAEDHRNGGLGRELFEEAIDWCGTQLPLFTVPAERYESFKPLLRRFRFNETARIRSMYRPGVTEHIFNGSGLQTLNS